MIKSIGNFFADHGLLIFFGLFFFLIGFLLISVSNLQRERDGICLQRQQVVVKYNGFSYCSNLNSLSPIK